MNVERIRELLDLMEARGLAELEIEEEGVRVRLVKTPPAPPQVTIAPAAAAAGPGAAAAGAPAEQAITSEDFVLKSPIVGTFYRAPSPEGDPFVEVGDEVGPETVVCIIEAMKVMNEIKAETTGMVREILVENAHAVEYGQPLFVLEPRSPGE